jgi:hypothetical protein
MNGTSDFDRAFVAWLDEGPRLAPERPMDLAVEHARRHPRRRDPLLFLRPDVMAPHRTGLLARPALVFALVGLLLVGVVGAAVIGSLPRDPSALPPGPTSSPTAPSPTPLPSPQTFEVIISDEVGNETLVSVVDASGVLVDAEAADIGDTFEGDGLVLTNASATAVFVSWVNCPTDTGNVLRIDAAVKSMILERGACAGDTMAVVKTIRLTFSRPVDERAVETSIIDPR